ncbi:nucleoside:proton symporter [Phormidium sp. CLA17]|uniref:NupC/NupG family nucleoside CNT transporter n=1 Tax=Leptolyngbya sp. Cla-17 TaxID=2803751 RepID=UPI0014916EA3|nr:nucleoside transporter C-terminal domain-containing protein [Leptolyngbya sp. Cla-17]MBM0740860.1 nucleoside:proton symporter [Leptolyngbya sp. Cla-17]
MSGLNFLSFIGIFALCGIAWLTSENRRIIPWRTIFWGIGLQLILGLLVFLIPATRSLMELLSDGVNSILQATEAGSRFVFGSLLVPDPISAPASPLLAGRWIARAVTPPYVPVPGDLLLSNGSSGDFISLGYIFAFRALPSVIFFSALMALLYTLGLIQPLVNGFARIFRHTMNLSGAEALSGASNIFVGIEATVLVRPYLERMTRSELCAILASCFGSIASTVLALYVGFLRPVFPNITGHLISASIMAIPACFVISKIVVPETAVPETMGRSLRRQQTQTDAVVEEELEPEKEFETVDRRDALSDEEIEPVRVNQRDHNPPAPLNLMESVVLGALDGVKLAAAIAALLIAILGLVALINLFFANLASLATSSQPFIRGIGRVFQIVSLQNILGALFLPLTFLTGVSLQWQELWQSSVLIGQRLILTEVPSYQQLAVLANQGILSPRALLVVSYALCGFAHLPSVGIFVGGLVSLVPSRRRDITELGWKALWAATLATLMIGCIAGVYDTGNPAVLGR